MPLFVLAELRLGVARSRQTEENAAQVDALVARCEVIRNHQRMPSNKWEPRGKPDIKMVSHTTHIVKG